MEPPFDGEHPTVPSQPTAPPAVPARRLKRMAWGRRVIVLLLVALVAAGLSGWLGVHTETASATGGGIELHIRYASVARPGLSVPWELRIARAGGFDSPVAVTVSQGCLTPLDIGVLLPDPASSRSTADAVVWEFEPPPTDEFAVSVGAHVDASTNMGRAHCDVRVASPPGSSGAAVGFTMLVLP
jgi:hypothetical protein